MYDVIVVGGGIVGLATAYHLVAAGARTLLVDRADVGQATAAGAGIMAPETSGLESDAWFSFAVQAVAYYPTLIERLQAAGAAETGYARTAQLVVAVAEDEAAAFAKAHQTVFARQRQRGRPGPEDLVDVDAAAARRLFPPLAPVRSAFYYRQAARVDGRLLATALRRAAEGQGLAVRSASVERLALEGAAVTGVVIAGETVRAGAVVIAGGAWSSAFAEQLGVRLPIVPQRGQIIHLRLPSQETAAWPIITAFHGHYLVPWPDNRVVVGATRESGSGFNAHTTAAGIHEVLGEALRVAPGLASATIGEIRVGLRPVTPDHLPLLGPVPTVRNAYIAAGHGATGLQLGPYSGKLLADLIGGRPVNEAMEALALTRFSMQ